VVIFVPPGRPPVAFRRSLGIIRITPSLARVPRKGTQWRAGDTLSLGPIGSLGTLVHPALDVPLVVPSAYFLCDLARDAYMQHRREVGEGCPPLLLGTW
jgi:hypothetical protein